MIKLEGTRKSASRQSLRPPECVTEELLHCEFQGILCGEGGSLVFSTLVAVKFMMWPIVRDVLFRPPDAGCPSQSVNVLKKSMSEAAADVITCGKTLNTLAMPAQ